MEELPKAYDPAAHEDATYTRWEASGFFNPDTLPGKRNEPFAIAHPPPNVTGVLHIGHAMGLAVQDLMIRFERMRGKRTLWIPGTDHAAIATQTVVEKKLIREGIPDPRHALGREAFLLEVKKFATASHDRIVTQMKKMGASLDWSREAYTLDEPRSHAVRVMFKKMYDDGLIYRGNRIVNWCPRCKSTLADDEVQYREEKTPFYYFKYGPVVIGTARPETKFLDKTIVVHPDDLRYKNIVGTSFEIEWIEGKVKANVITSSVIDKEFGTGAMTITPAHSFEDFALAQEHGLPVVQIIDEDGNFTNAVGAFVGKNARKSRDAIVDILKKKNLVDHIDENYVHNLSVCYRCDTPIEPLPKLQWFIDVKKIVRGKSLKDRMREAVGQKDDQVKILPERFLKTYFHWIDNLRDWCISRQIWFGHRVPVWYCKACGPQKGNSEDCAKPIVSEKIPNQCPHCGGLIEQDSDTLDTWFSSGLWTFSTLGWPEKTKDFATFHPTSVLETAYEILFFWVARMIMMSTYALNEIPFKTVYLHGLVRDEQGRKMSKSLGNGIDPLDMVATYGADATRLALIIGTSPGNDVKLSEEKIAGFRNFTNKLWNIARFVLTVAGESKDSNKKPKPVTLADAWIMNELDAASDAVTKHLEKFEFSAAGELLREFTWGSFADWYIEIAKLQLAFPEQKENTSAILHHVLRELLILWHPFMPFVTEVLWKEVGDGEMLIIHKWPKAHKKIDESQRVAFSLLQEIVVAIRNIRAGYRIAPGQPIDAVLIAGKDAAWLKDQITTITHLARLGTVAVLEKGETPEGAATVVVQSITVAVPLAGMVDATKERTRLTNEITETEKYLASVDVKLSNKEFTSRAPAHIVDGLRTIRTETETKLAMLKDQLKALE